MHPSCVHPAWVYTSWVHPSWTQAQKCNGHKCIRNVRNRFIIDQRLLYSLWRVEEAMQERTCHERNRFVINETVALYTDAHALPSLYFIKYKEDNAWTHLSWTHPSWTHPSRYKPVPSLYFIKRREGNAWTQPSWAHNKTMQCNVMQYIVEYTTI